MIALSGVRSSCDILARKLDLVWLASSAASRAAASCRLLTSISENRCAFWIASTDCAAKVFTSSIVPLGNSPGSMRRTTSAPTASLERTSGTSRRAITRLHDDVIDYGWRLVLQVADLIGLTLLSRLADGVGEDGMLVPDRLDQFLVHAVGRTQPVFAYRFIENVDCAGLGAGKLRRLSDDRGEHGLK